MNTVPPQLPHEPPQPPAPLGGPRRRSSALPPSPTWRRVFDESVPLIGVPAFYGPPIIFILGPWLMLVLLLVGPIALLLTGLLVLVAAGGVLALLAAVFASPYLLIRHLHAHRTLHVKPGASHWLRAHRVSAVRLASPQPKGMS